MASRSVGAGETGPNVFVTELATLAQAKGWVIVGFTAKVPCSITLMDHHGTELSIVDEYGLRMKDYLERLPTAYVRQPVAEDVVR